MGHYKKNTVYHKINHKKLNFLFYPQNFDMSKVFECLQSGQKFTPEPG